MQLGTTDYFFVIYALVTSILFIRKDIISEQAVFTLNKKLPFMHIQNNVIEDYDEHDIENVKLDEAKQALKLKLQAEKNTSPTAEVRASVYQYNPTAIAIIFIYVIYFFWFFKNILS